MKKIDLTLEISHSGSVLRSFVYLEGSEDQVHNWDSLGNGKFKKVMKGFHSDDDILSVELYIEGKTGASANLKTTINGTLRTPEINCIVPKGMNSNDKTHSYAL